MSTNTGKLPNAIIAKRSCHQKISYRDIKLTYHVRDRAQQRLGITNKEEIQKLAHSAKYKGIKIKSLSATNHESLGLSYYMYIYLKNHYGHHHGSDKIYYYKNYVYVFSGDRSAVLKSIVPCFEEDMREAIAKMNKNKNTEHTNTTPDLKTAKIKSSLNCEPVCEEVM